MYIDASIKLPVFPFPLSRPPSDAMPFLASSNFAIVSKLSLVQFFPPRRRILELELELVSKHWES